MKYGDTYNLPKVGDDMYDRCDTPPTVYDVLEFDLYAAYALCRLHACSLPIDIT